MQIIAVEPGHALCEGRGYQRRVNTALVDTLSPGDWVLIFIDSAQERLTPERAMEINTTLNLMEAVMRGESTDLPVGFALPSAMRQQQFLALSGASH